MRISPLLSLLLTSSGLSGWLAYGVGSTAAPVSDTANNITPQADSNIRSDKAADEKSENKADGLSQNAQSSIGTKLSQNMAEPTFSEAFSPVHTQPLAAADARKVSPTARAAATSGEAVQVAPFEAGSIDRLKIREVVSRSFVTSPIQNAVLAPSPTAAFALAESSSAADRFVAQINGSDRFLASSGTAFPAAQILPVPSNVIPPTGQLISQLNSSENGLFNNGVTPPTLAAPRNVMPPTAQPVRQPPATLPLSTGVDENYILGPGDIIEVSFFNVPEYSGQHRLSTSGTIDLPLIGRVLIRGLTVSQASAAIANRYVSQLQDPIVSINVLQPRPLQVAITGEIAQPGLYTLGSQSGEYPRLFQALQQAGGLTQSADLTQIKVRREAADGSTTVLTVDLLALLQNGDIKQNIFLQDGDSIVITSATELNPFALSQLSGSNLDAKLERPLDVAVVGEVSQPGPYQLETSAGRVTLVQALQQAGGITPSANLRQVQLRRQTRSGREQLFDVNLWKLLQNGDLDQDLVLQQGDTILVPTALASAPEEVYSLTSSSLSTGTIQINVIGEVESPGGLQVRANTSFNEALLASGGLNRRSQKDATLVRFNPDGTVERRSINVDLSKDINSETNPLLQPNDVIVVGRSGRAAFDDSLGGLNNTLNLLLPFLLFL